MISRLTNDVAGARPARLRRRGDAVRLVADADRHGGDPVLARRRARAADAPDLPGAGDRVVRVPDHLRRRLPDHAREDRRDHRLPAGDAVGHPRRARVRAGAAAQRALRRPQRGEPRGEHDDGLPQRRLLPGCRAAVRAGDRRDPVLRRRPGDPGRRDGRRAGRIHRRAEQLLRPDPAAVAALHDLPGGHGGAGQDLRAARRGARPRRRADASSCRQLRGEIDFDDVIFSYGSEDTGDALCHIDLHVPPGQTVALVGATGAGKSTLAKLVARFYDPTSGRILVDGHDLRDVGGVLAALADGHRAPGGVPVQRHDRREHRVRPRRRDAARRSRRRRGRSAPTTSSSRWSTATRPRSASAAPSSPPASASSSRSPAR